MEYLRIDDFVKKYKLEEHKEVISRLLFDSDWYNDEDLKIYFGVFMVTNTKEKKNIVLDGIWVVVVEFDELKNENTTFNDIIEELDKLYKVVPSKKIKGSYMLVRSN
jgi:hypothetical protein